MHSQTSVGVGRSQNMSWLVSTASRKNRHQTNVQQKGESNIARSSLELVEWALPLEPTVLRYCLKHSATLILPPLLKLPSRRTCWIILFKLFFTAVPNPSSDTWVCACVCVCVCVCLKCPVLPPCAVHGCSRNLLYYYYCKLPALIETKCGWLKKNLRMMASNEGGLSLDSDLLRLPLTIVRWK